MTKYFKIVLIFIILCTKLEAQNNYIGIYKIGNKNSSILSAISTIRIEKNNIIFLKTFFHQDGWKIYKGNWHYKNNKIIITNLQDTGGKKPPKNRLLVEMDSIISVKDSIRINITDYANFTEVEPAIITINNLLKIKSKSTDSVFIKCIPIFKIKVDLWGFQDSVIFKHSIKTSFLKLILRNDRFGTSNYYYKNIILNIRDKNIYLSDGSKLIRIKESF